MFRATEEKFYVVFVCDCQICLSRFSLSMHMHVHFTATVDHSYNKQIYEPYGGSS